ncbi:cytidine deaminase [Roseimicrobium gellanilyticum]|uniref:Cytidine deaminase n=1 Tax=Roseimicrobium gellanilyticum TaxID=748857 RepID=A0A366HU12_9BACT|nr:cytidine deaminase [Roseimicrobium gellanilyticum]RBP46404.1 cytidine deaminase [Roseimicrobium gellanilyticum]
MNPRTQELIDIARPLVRNLTLGRSDFSAATVASAIRTSSGNVYTGVCIHLSCGLGFCAEHAAAAEMIKAGETRIETIVAVAEDCILSPCGRCREFLIQVDPANAEANVVLEGGREVKLGDLLPHHWLVSGTEVTS